MRAYRISGKKYISDLSGEGARRNGGRWNRIGVSVLYTGSNHSVAALEYFVHLGNKIKLKDNSFGKITIEILDGSIKEVKKEDILGWPAESKEPDERLKILYSIREDLFKITDDWIAEGKYLCLDVPSVASPGDHNYLINPKHPLATPDNVKIIGDVEEYVYDSRIFNKELDRSTSLDELIASALALLGINPRKK